MKKYNEEEYTRLKLDILKTKLKTEQLKCEQAEFSMLIEKIKYEKLRNVIDNE